MSLHVTRYMQTRVHRSRYCSTPEDSTGEHLVSFFCVFVQGKYGKNFEKDNCVNVRTVRLVRKKKKKMGVKTAEQVTFLSE